MKDKYHGSEVIENRTRSSLSPVSKNYPKISSITQLLKYEGQGKEKNVKKYIVGPSDPKEVYMTIENSCQ